MTSKKRIALLDLEGLLFQSIDRSNEKIDWKIISNFNEKHESQMDLGENKFQDFILDYNHQINKTL